MKNIQPSTRVTKKKWILNFIYYLNLLLYIPGVNEFEINYNCTFLEAIIKANYGQLGFSLKIEYKNIPDPHNKSGFRSKNRIKVLFLKKLEYPKPLSSKLCRNIF